MADVVDLKSGDKITGQFNNDGTQSDLTIAMMHDLQDVVKKFKEAGLMQALINNNLAVLHQYEIRNQLRGVE